MKIDSRLGANDMAKEAERSNIYVTKPFLPPLDEFVSYLETIWKNQVLTNCGPLHELLERKLADYLGVEFLALFNNGTNALITALQALELKGEVITTPFTFVATSNALIWNGNTPVFVDIDSTTLNLDPEKIEAAITPLTSAILPVHCYGNPCDTAAIQSIADRHGLKVIYDAAHAFGVKDESGSVLSRGELSTLSFHATKVFHTFEGGAIVCKDANMKRRIDQLKNFGIVDELTIEVAGSNGKMSEVQAAMGLTQLRYVDQLIESRGKIDKAYRDAFAGVPGIRPLPKLFQTVSNFAYFPILVGPEYPMSRDGLYDHLRTQNIMSRRYFFPLMSTLPMYKILPSAHPSNLPVANIMGQRILCLPIYPEMTNPEQERVVTCIKTGFEAVTGGPHRSMFA